MNSKNKLVNKFDNLSTMTIANYYIKLFEQTLKKSNRTEWEITTRILYYIILARIVWHAKPKIESSFSFNGLNSQTFRFYATRLKIQ